jgi:predicted DNA binding protein
MSLFGEFHVPAGAFALQETLCALPDLIIEVERIVASDDVLTPYFWINGVDRDRFEQTVAADSTVREVTYIDDDDRSLLYRAEWADPVESLVCAWTDLGATVLGASAQRDEWELRMRFRDRGALEAFQSYCSENDVQYQLRQLFARAHPRGVAQYELTEKQHEALLTAWEMGYFSSSEVSLEDVANEIGISLQSLSERLYRGHDSLIENTLAVTPPTTTSPAVKQ